MHEPHDNEEARLGAETSHVQNVVRSGSVSVSIFWGLTIQSRLPTLSNIALYLLCRLVYFLSLIILISEVCPLVRAAFWPHTETLTSMSSTNNSRRKHFVSLPKSHQKLLPDYLDQLEAIDLKILENAAFLNDLAETAGAFLQDSEEMTEPTGQSTEVGHDRLRSTLRQIVRDWSKEGAAEREIAYGPILETLDRLVEGLSEEEKSEYHVLVPGAGLGRLQFEICKRKMSAQGNECSIYMLMVSNYLLNHTTSPLQHVIYPWVHSMTNVRNMQDLLQPVQVPDILPSELPPGLMSMASGDFVEVYSRESQRRKWNCVVTCFFIDTGSNIIEYLETIKNCLAIGGTWISIGPLQFGEDGLEIAMEDLLGLAGRMGFLIKDERFIDTGYTANANSMLKYVYNSVFFTATRAADQ